MQLISTTQLRTQSRDLVKTLREGKSVDLIHRSEIVGEIKPKIKGRLFDANRFLKSISGLKLPILNDKEIDRRYREAMELKHGKSIPRYK